LGGSFSSNEKISARDVPVQEIPSLNNCLLNPGFMSKGISSPMADERMQASGFGATEGLRNKCIKQESTNG
jgi:hypothetical protein